MITVDAYYFYLLIFCSAAVLVITCCAVVRLERRCSKIESLWASPTGSAMAGASDDLAEQQKQTIERLERRVGELQRTIEAIGDAQSRPVEATTPTERQLPIENAARMAKLGASIDDLTKSCGLNIGEARLMQKLHGKVAFAADRIQ